MADYSAFRIIGTMLGGYEVFLIYLKVLYISVVMFFA